MSREYKVMLRPQRFQGKEKALVAQAKAVWHDLSTSIARIVVGTDGDLGRIKTRRSITFFDTRKRLLNGAHYIFRERRDTDTRKRDMTLKFRHPDRYVAQNRDMEARPATDARTKFEEDIKAPFVSLYSFSTRLTVDDDTVFGALGDVRRVFQTVGKIDGFREDEEVAAVGGFTAHELVLDGAVLTMGKAPRIDAECALIVWYDDRDRDHDRPVAVELSYRYGDKDEDYGGGVTRRAFEVFNAIQSELTEWVDPKPRTKTAFVFQ